VNASSAAVVDYKQVGSWSLRHCLQDLMQAALLASTPALAAALRQVLGGLHSQKRVAGVDAMLLRLYRPILFRALGAANAAVRRNALLLLLDAFPLRVRGCRPMSAGAGAQGCGAYTASLRFILTLFFNCIIFYYPNCML
jgi:hypothetical protein